MSVRDEPRWTALGYSRDGAHPFEPPLPVRSPGACVLVVVLVLALDWREGETLCKIGRYIAASRSCEYSALVDPSPTWDLDLEAKEAR